MRLRMGCSGASARLVLVAVLLGGPARAAAQQPVPGDTTGIPASVRAMIDSVNADWIPALNRRDAAGIAAPYADDGVLITATGESFRGRAAVEQAMRESVARITGTVSGRLVQDGLTRAGPLLYEWGHAEMEIARPGREPAHGSGRYLTVWRLEADGRWRISRNLSLP
jgi:uncharacterized protein (TIGR02246 family)